MSRGLVAFSFQFYEPVLREEITLKGFFFFKV